MSETIIFLDFDGPLSNPRVTLFSGDDDAFDPLAVTTFNNICALTGARIVCTSTRAFARSSDDRADACARFAKAGLDLKHLHQDWSCYYDDHRKRADHIRAWLAEHPEVSRYAVIDDEDAGTLNLIRVSDMNGLQVEDYEKLGVLVGFDVAALLNFTRARRKEQEKAGPGASGPLQIKPL